MQNFEQVKDVIEYSKNIHQRLHQIYGSLDKKERPEREKMLLDYLIEKQLKIEDLLSNFETESQQSILNNWMQFTPNDDINQFLDDQQAQVEMSFAEIIQFADLCSDKFVAFYNEAANESELPKVKLIFENLKNMAIQTNRQQNDAALFKAI